MNDDTEQVPCPVCHRLITVVLVWEDADYSVGIFGGWTGGIAIEDTACFDHCSYEQREAVLDAAIAQHGSEPPDDRDFPVCTRGAD
jgi:C4-type Zn-finger protein